MLQLQTNSLCKGNKGYQGYRKYKLDSDKETREGKAREKKKRKGRFWKQGDRQAMFLKVCHDQSEIFSTLLLFSLDSPFYCPVFVIPNTALSAALSACLYVHKIVCLCVCVCASVPVWRQSDTERAEIWSGRVCTVWAGLHKGSWLQTVGELLWALPLNMQKKMDFKNLPWYSLDTAMCVTCVIAYF